MYLFKHYIQLIISFLLFGVVSAEAQNMGSWKDMFKDPPAIYRPTPFLHLNGKLDSAELYRQIKDVKVASGFGGLTILPVTAQPGFGSSKLYPGMDPMYTSKEYRDYFGYILKTAKEFGLQVIWYDDVDFPSGTAGGEVKNKFPHDTRKVLSMKDTLVTGDANISMAVPSGKLMAAVAMNTVTKDRIDIGSSVSNQQLNWKAPAGQWKIMFFTSDVVLKGSINENAVDYLDPEAIDRYFTLNHDLFAERFSSYFGNTIQKTFFDDVGFYTGSKRGEKTWTDKFNEKFKVLTGKDPSLYYPALWGDIGPETEAARIAFFNTRAELLAEGYPRKATEWSAKHGLLASGHPPGNYEIQPVDMNADIIKYYRHEAIPTMDLIFFYGHGREGYKLVSSAGNLYDRPIVAAEIYGAINWFTKNEMDRNLLYRGAMDVFTRGINFLIPHGMWYNPDSNAVRIPPLISAYSKDLGPALPDYNAWAGRSCMLLQGGKTVSDIAVVYPIQSLEAWFYFDAKDNKGVGKYVAPGTDYLAISDILTNQVHRDFTFLHPETIASDLFTVGKGNATLNNKVNKQEYKIMILPGGKVISLKTLEKIRTFYEAGGAVIATSVLPSRSAEFGEDMQVQTLVKALFGVDPSLPAPTTMIEANNAKGGKLIFIPAADVKTVTNAFDKLGIVPDLSFENNPQPSSGKGVLSYIHKQKDGKDIYLIANSSNDAVQTNVELRGKLLLEFWNPHDGTIKAVSNVQYFQKGNQTYTRFALDLPAVHSLFVVGQ